MRGDITGNRSITFEPLDNHCTTQKENTVTYEYEIFLIKRLNSIQKEFLPNLQNGSQTPDL